MKKSVYELLQQAINNVNKDRQVTNELLEDVLQYLSKNEAHHREVGTIAAKYVETLQRSNEQLVKISALIQKKNSEEDNQSIDSNMMFDMINDATDAEEVKKDE